jgi:hypothetical protein
MRVHNLIECITGLKSGMGDEKFIKFKNWLLTR